jgi:hypothetical protein
MSRSSYIISPKPVELLPASLLLYRQTWQPLVQSLPGNAYLIVTNLDHQPQNASMLRLVHSLRRCGEVVYVLAVGRKESHRWS